MKILDEGIRLVDGEFVFDYNMDKLDDIINLTGPKIYSSKFGDNAYYFGYKFNDGVSSKIRTSFIHYLKNDITDSEFRRMAERPLNSLRSSVDFKNIKAVIYPVSRLNNVVTKLGDIVGNFMYSGTIYSKYEVVKNIPSKIEFDWEGFARHCGGEDSQAYKDSKSHILKMLYNIHNLEYFSIARDVKTKYRPYIANYLKMPNKLETAKLQSLLSSDNVLIIDDINTSGSTLHELIRIVRGLNNDCGIYIYTLIGRG